MRRIGRFFRETIWLFAYALIILAAVCTKVAKGQTQPVVGTFWTETTAPFDTRLPRFSEYRAPPIYKEWAREIAECEGLEPLPDSVFARVQFFQVNAPFFRYEENGMVVLAVTFYRTRQVFLGSPYIWNESLIKHEILHLVLEANGYHFGNFHPIEIFGRCFT